MQLRMDRSVEPANESDSGPGDRIRDKEKKAQGDAQQQQQAVEKHPAERNKRQAILK